jgi:hypothetical protein
MTVVPQLQQLHITIESTSRKTGSIGAATNKTGSIGAATKLSEAIARVQAWDASVDSIKGPWLASSRGRVG